MSKTQAELSADCPAVIGQMIESGDLAKLGGKALAIYLALKTASDTLTKSHLATQLGLSLAAVQQGLDELEQAGYVRQSYEVA